MVCVSHKAIASLKSRGGASRVAIRSYLLANGSEDSPAFKRSVREALKKGVSDGYFVQVCTGSLCSTWDAWLFLVSWFAPCV